ncbi:hypothetical protein Gotur_009991, partial [Gossypium turneri]
DDFEEGKDEEPKEVKEGVASIALLPNGSLSGHFIQLPQSICYGLHGTELACEMECSRGEDYRLIKLTIIDYNNKKDHTVVVECRGHDAARFHNINHAHGWEKDVVDMVEEKEGKKKILVSFECETLKSDKAAEEHIKQFMPKLSGLDAVGIVSLERVLPAELECRERLPWGFGSQIREPLNCGHTPMYSRDALGSVNQALRAAAHSTLALNRAQKTKPSLAEIIFLVVGGADRLPRGRYFEDFFWKSRCPLNILKLPAEMTSFNIGRMSISGMDSEAETADSKQDLSTA